MAFSMHYPFLDCIGAKFVPISGVKGALSCRKMLQFNSGHKANVFQSKFLPGDLLITSCSRDGQVAKIPLINLSRNHSPHFKVRLAELSVTGSLRSTKKLAQHRGPAHKMTLLPDSPYIVLSAGEDGQVLNYFLKVLSKM